MGLEGKLYEVDGANRKLKTNDAINRSCTANEGRIRRLSLIHASKKDREINCEDFYTV
jgi:hypothetical protein